MGNIKMASRAGWLGRLMAQARVGGLHSPLVWTTAASFDGVLEDKLRDLVTLAPSTWDAIVRDLVRVTMMLHTSTGCLKDVKATLARCFELVRGSPKCRGMSDPCHEMEPCPILAEYRPAIQHVLDSTFLMVYCVFGEMNLEAAPVARCISKYESLDRKQQSAVYAIRAQVKLTCHLGLSVEATAGDQNLQRTNTFLDAMLLASKAKEMHREEGQWKALYGDMLPDTNPRKLTLLRNAARARRTPYTLTCLSKYLYKLGEEEAFDLCSDVLVEWPRSVHANVSYVIMYLSCTVPGKLSHWLAEHCLLRLQRLVPPTCFFVQGLALELRSLEVNAASANEDPSHVKVDGVVQRQRPVRAKPFEPFDAEAIEKARNLYYGQGAPGGPRSIISVIERGPPGRVTLDECNCVCSGSCARLTYKVHGTLLVRGQPTACYAE